MPSPASPIPSEFRRERAPVPTSAQDRLLALFARTALLGTLAAMLGILLYFLYAFATLYHGGEPHRWILDTFSDFVSIMYASLSDSPYVEYGSSYPPLAIMALYPFALICRGTLARYSYLGDSDIIELTSRVILHPPFWIALVLFFLTCTVPILYLLARLLPARGRGTLSVMTTALFSAPFVYAVMRGNATLLALIPLLLFLLLYEHPRASVREVAYLCLALSGVMKIYPLFFGVFVLRKRRLLAAARIALYTLLLFLLSFLIFRGGMGETSNFLMHLRYFASSNARLESMRNLSLSSLLYKGASLLSPTLPGTGTFSVINAVAVTVLLLVCALSASLTRSTLSRTVIASSAVILIPAISYYYVLIFALIPFLVFVRDLEELPRWKRGLYASLFLFLLFTPALLTFCYIPQALCILALLLCELFEVARGELLPWLRKRIKA